MYTIFLYGTCVFSLLYALLHISFAFDISLLAMPLVLIFAGILFYFQYVFSVKKKGYNRIPVVKKLYQYLPFILLISFVLRRIGGNPTSHIADVCAVMCWVLVTVMSFVFQYVLSDKRIEKGFSVSALAQELGVPAEEDSNLRSLLAANTEYVAIFGKSHIMHVTDVIKATPEENLAMIGESVKFLTEHGKKVIFDAEHFFDGYKTDAAYAMKALETANAAGAYTLCLCDTNGGIFPDEAYEITRKVTERFPDTIVAIHCHNDGGLAVADSIEAVKAGARQVQGTFLGFGERCGNANLSTIICNLQLKRGYECIPPEKLKEIYQSAMAIAETANVAVPENQPYIGMNAFAHKAGMHADGVLKYSSSFEHVDPESVGNKRKLPLSEISGKSAIYDKLKNYFPSLDKNGKEMSEIVAALKERSLSGYQYEGAEASFILLVEKILGKYKSSFDLINYKVINELPAIEGKVSSAIIKIRVDGTTKISASDGEGPVHAMDLALRSALSDFYPEIRKVTLTDFKVRVLDSDKATAAKVRVLITSANGADSWTTVGVSEDIIEASWTALTDSIDYALMRR